MKTIVTKAEYARLKGRVPSAVSNWIAEGKISSAALIGDGVRARIWLEQADADLIRNLDPGQQAGQLAPVVVTSATSEPAPLSSPRAANANDDEDIRRRRKADADKAEHEAEAARRRLAIDEGRWIDTQEAAKAWGREFSRRLAEFEDFLCNKLARENGARFSVDWKAEAVRYRQMFRNHRIVAADSAKTEREGIEAGELVAAE